MRKKWKWIIAVVIILLCFRACSSRKTEKPAELAKPLPTVAQTAPTETTSGKRDADFYSGTWVIAGVRIDGVDFTLEQITAFGAEGLDSVRLVLSSNGSCQLTTPEDSIIAVWTADEDGIQIDELPLPYNDGQLLLETADCSFILEKQSDNQTFTEDAAPAETEEETTAPTTEAPTEPETTAATGIRKEFKDAMDSYEAFYDEYFAFMEEYKKNPTNLSLLGKYAEMLTKVEDMDKKFKAWETGDLTNEELKYYMDVLNRVQKKMIDLF